MSQFWQNLQARLQPAVPKENTRRAGEEVVQRLLLDRVDRRSPSCGRRWSAPSRRPRAGARSTGRAGRRAAGSRAGTGRTGCGRRRSACHQRAGRCSSGAGRRAPHQAIGSPFGELAHPVARQPQVVGPEVGRQPGLALERGEERRRLGQLLPDLRQEGGAAAAPFEDHAVDAGPQRGAAPRPRCARPAARAAPSSETSICSPANSSRAQRREARVVEGRGQRVARARPRPAARAASSRPMQPRSCAAHGAASRRWRPARSSAGCAGSGSGGQRRAPRRSRCARGTAARAQCGRRRRRRRFAPSPRIRRRWRAGARGSKAIAP